MQEQPESITCPKCWMTSYSPNDVREGYCGNCQWWTSHPTLGLIDVEPGPAHHGGPERFLKKLVQEFTNRDEEHPQ